MESEFGVNACGEMAVGSELVGRDHSIITKSDKSGGAKISKPCHVGVKRVYLASGRFKDRGRFDIPDLIRDIAGSLSAVKRIRFEESMNGYTSTLLNARTAAAREIVRSHALLAATSGTLNPMPLVGSAVSLGIIVSMNREVARCFGLSALLGGIDDGGSDNPAGGLMDLSSGAAVEAVRAASDFSTKYLAEAALGNFLVTCSAPGAGGLCSMGSAEVAKLVPIFGSLVAGTSTFVTVRALGIAAVKSAAEASARVYDVLRQVIRCPILWEISSSLKDV